jgi:hypothetical protein
MLMRSNYWQPRFKEGLINSFFVIPAKAGIQLQVDEQ